MATFAPVGIKAEPGVEPGNVPGFEKFVQGTDNSALSAILEQSQKQTTPTEPNPRLLVAALSTPVPVSTPPVITRTPTQLNPSPAPTTPKSAATPAEDQKLTVAGQQALAEMAYARANNAILPLLTNEAIQQIRLKQAHPTDADIAIMFKAAADFIKAWKTFEDLVPKGDVYNNLNRQLKDMIAPLNDLPVSKRNSRINFPALMRLQADPNNIKYDDPTLLKDVVKYHNLTPQQRLDPNMIPKDVLRLNAIQKLHASIYE